MVISPLIILLFTLVPNYVPLLNWFFFSLFVGSQVWNNTAFQS